MAVLPLVKRTNRQNTGVSCLELNTPQDVISVVNDQTTCDKRLKSLKTIVKTKISFPSQSQKSPHKSPIGWLYCLLLSTLRAGHVIQTVQSQWIDAVFLPAGGIKTLFTAVSCRVESETTELASLLDIPSLT